MNVMSKRDWPGGEKGREPLVAAETVSKMVYG